MAGGRQPASPQQGRKKPHFHVEGVDLTGKNQTLWSWSFCFFDGFHIWWRFLWDVFVFRFLRVHGLSLLDHFGGKQTKFPDVGQSTYMRCETMNIEASGLCFKGASVGLSFWGSMLGCGGWGTGFRRIPSEGMLLV